MYIKSPFPCSLVPQLHPYLYGYTPNPPKKRKNQEMATKLVLPYANTLLLLFLSLSPTAIASVVLDIEGNPLDSVSKYYIRPWGTGFRGGLTRASKPGQLCPQYVTQSPYETDIGQPVRFFPADGTQRGRIHLFSDLNIAFGPSFCRSDGVWSLTHDPYTGQIEVSADGYLKRSERNLFQITPGQDPRINVYTITAGGVGMFRPLGIFRDYESGLDILGFSYDIEPLQVVFVKKTDRDSSSIQSY